MHNKLRGGVGSSFDTFLDEEGVLAETEAPVARRIRRRQLEAAAAVHHSDGADAVAAGGTPPPDES